MKKCIIAFILILINFRVSAQSLPTALPRQITATIGYNVNGNMEYASGHYEIWHKTANGPTNLITKPIIIAEGIDFFENIQGQAITPQNVYENFNTFENLLIATQLRAAGYDIIILNYNNSGTYIQKNAFLLVKLLQDINTELAANGSTSKNVVTGVSMGGVVARYALAYMEQQGLNHNTRLFCSYDSPQQGATFPLALQYYAQNVFYGVPAWLANSVFGINTYNAIASKQMLVYHYSATVNTGSPGYPSPDPLHTAFYNELKNLNNQTGYPQTCRRIAVANGNKVAENQITLNGGPRPAPAGGYSLNYSSPSGLSAQLGSVPAPGPGILPTVAYTICGIQDYAAGSYAGGVYPAQPYEVAPGGNIPWFQIFHDGFLNVFPNGSCSAYTPSTTFIPTMSALDINHPDLIYNINSDENIICKTPFQAFYAPIAGNNMHTSLSEIEASWLYNQIVNEDNVWLINSTATSFNFGRNNNITTDNVISQSVLVENSGRLNINTATALDVVARYSFAGVFPQNPSTYSNFNVLITGCNSNTVTIRNGGELTLGAGSTRTGTVNLTSGANLTLGLNGILRLNSGSNFVVKQGSTLDLNGGKLIINNNSQLVIEEGATLQMSQNTIIELNGDNAILEIKGNLIVGPNTTFTFTAQPTQNTGFIKFALPNKTNYAANITVAATSQIKFEGRSITDKILEIAPSTYINYSDWDLNAIDFKNGLIKMGKNSKVYLTKNSTVNYAHFEGDRVNNNSKTYPGYLAVEAYPSTNLEQITNSKFTGGQTGLAVTLYIGDLYKMSNNTFSGCGIGFRGVNSHVDFTGCTFSFNNTGWRMDAGGQATIKNCNFSNNKDGVEFYASNSGIFSFENSNAYNNQDLIFNGNGNGIKISGPATVKGKCSVFAGNDVGILLQNNTYLDLSYNPLTNITPAFRFNNYYHNLRFSGANGLTLNNGYNYFDCEDYSGEYNTYVSSPYYGTAGISGDLNYNLLDPRTLEYHPVSLPFLANNNWWNLKQPAASPETKPFDSYDRFDYRIYINESIIPDRPSYRYFTLEDNSPNSISETLIDCSATGELPGGPGGSRLSNNFGLNAETNNQSNARQQSGSTPSVSILALKIAVQQATPLYRQNNLNGNDLNALSLLHYAFINANPDTSQADREVLDEAYRLIRQIYASSLITDTVTTAAYKLSLMDQVTNKVIYWQQQVGNSKSLYYTWMNRTLDAYSGGDIYEARSFLANAFPFANADNMNYAQYWNCLISANILLQDSMINSQQFYAMLDSCSGLYNLPPANRHANFTRQAGSHEAATSISLYPNPIASDEVTLQFELKQEDEINIALIDVKGNVVKTLQRQKSLKAGVHEILLNVDERPSGLYLVRVQGKHFHKQAKLVIQK